MIPSAENGMNIALDQSYMRPLHLYVKIPNGRHIKANTPDIVIKTMSGLPLLCFLRRPLGGTVQDYKRTRKEPSFFLLLWNVVA